MGESDTKLLNTLLQLSKEDATLARLLAERKKLEADFKAKKQQRDKLEGDLKTREKVLHEKRYHAQRDEKVLQEEREKLVQRRKTLASLGNYKTQQAAAREIEHSGRELNTREESVLSALNEVESIEKETAGIKEQLVTLEAELSVAETEVKETLVNIEGRTKTHQDERTRLAAMIDASNLSTYNRIKDRFPMDPVVSVKKNSICGGCFMQVPPQHMVQMGRGDTLIKCRGCGRMLFLEEPLAAPGAAPSKEE